MRSTIRTERQARRQVMPDGTHQLVVLSEWRWRLLDRMAGYNTGGIDNLMAHFWEMSDVYAVRGNTTGRAQLLSAIIEDSIDRWYPRTDNAGRRRPANANRRPDACARVLWGWTRVKSPF